MRPSVQFKLRDWLISRQRYWGPPIPIIHCPKDGPVAVPEEDLPVLLPEVEDFRPRGTGMSPLATVEEWVNVHVPEMRRARASRDRRQRHVPRFRLVPPPLSVDRLRRRRRSTRNAPTRGSRSNMYIGGNEHAVRHLLYARFVMRALHDMGMVPAARAVHPIPRARHDHHGRRQDVEESRQRAQSRRVHRPLRRRHACASS